MSSREKQYPASETWLRRMAAGEDECISVSVGGFALDAGLEVAGPTAEFVGAFPDEIGANRVAFARFLDLARRRARLSLEEVAMRATVALEELVRIAENYERPSPRTVFRLAQVFEVRNERLMELAGLVEPRQEVAEAAVKFAARSEPTAQLSEIERVALEEFVKVLVETTDNG